MPAASRWTTCSGSEAVPGQAPSVPLIRAAVLLRLHRRIGVLKPELPGRVVQVSQPAKAMCDEAPALGDPKAGGLAAQPLCLLRELCVFGLAIHITALIRAVQRKRPASRS